MIFICFLVQLRFKVPVQSLLADTNYQIIMLMKNQNMHTKSENLLKILDQIVVMNKLLGYNLNSQDFFMISLYLLFYIKQRQFLKINFLLKFSFIARVIQVIDADIHAFFKRIFLKYALRFYKKKYGSNIFMQIKN